ncbi:hypothetical protein BH09VER1_BH09VER1_40790 [soil metagenome]
MHPKNLLALALLFTASAFADGFSEMKAAKHIFAKSDKSEAARTAYVATLASIFHHEVVEHIRTNRGNADLVETLSLELGQYPAPKNSDSKAFTKLLVGRWQSPRHIYLFRNDGTWRLAPKDGTTHGTWHIKGNQFTQSYHSKDNPSNDSKATETIILLNQEYFVFGDTRGVYFEYRL